MACVKANTACWYWESQPTCSALPPFIPISYSATINITGAAVQSTMQVYVSASENNDTIKKILTRTPIAGGGMSSELTVASNEWGHSTSLTYERADSCQYDCKNGSSCPDPARCTDALLKLCAAAQRASTGDCLVCAGTHASTLRQAGCSENQLDEFCAAGPPPSPPSPIYPPMTACATSVAAFAIDPFVFLALNITNKTLTGPCTSPDGARGQQWQVTPPSPMNRSFLAFCIDVSVQPVVPLTVSITIPQENPTDPNTMVIRYSNFVGGQPPSAVFDIPTTCRC